MPISPPRTATAALVLLGCAALAQLAVAGPAVAATPTCSITVTYQGAWVPAAANGSVNCNMVRGTNSDAVRQLQDSMNDCYAARFESSNPALWPLVQDGDFGGNTEKALKQVQGYVRITADGKYGPVTRKSMLHTTPLYADPCKYVT